MARVIAVANQKGGVGKTTTSVNLGASIAAAERRVLLIDLDPQANASSGFGIPPQPLDSSIYAAISGETSLQTLRQKTELETLDIVPSGPDLYGIDMELGEFDDRLNRLRAAMLPIKDDYDIIVIDCPPSLSLLTLNALCASDSILIPMQCEYYALEGLTQLMNTLAMVQSGPNPDLEIEGVLLTMFDARNNLSRQVANDVRENFPGRVFETVIPRNVRLSEAPSFGRPIILYDISSRGSRSYIDLAREVLAPPSQTALPTDIPTEQIEQTP